MSETGPRPRRVSTAAMIRWGALALGVILFAVTLYYINFRTAFGTIKHLGVALPLAIGLSGLWHLARTWAWAWCFPQPRQVSFLRLARVRLSAEAFSYLTLRGIAGEPLKVVLLADRVDARQATAAVALERLAYMVGTTVIVGIGSLLAIAGLPLTRIWFRVFRAFAIAAFVVTILTAIVITGRGTYITALVRHIDRVFGTSWSGGLVSRFIAAVERQMLDLVRGHPGRLAVLVFATVVSYVLMALEAYVILRASGVAITPNGALAVETFSRVASFGSSFIPANLGALEASSLAAVTAIGAAGGGAALALARRIRGLFWAGIGLAVYPRGARPMLKFEDEPEQKSHEDERRGTLLYIPFDKSVRVSPAARVAGLAIAERVIRAASRANYERIVVWLNGQPSPVISRVSRDVDAQVTLARTRDEWTSALANASDDVVTVIGAGSIVSPALFADARALAPDADPALRDVPAGPEWPESGVLRVRRSTAGDPEHLERALAQRRTRALPLPTGDDVSFGRARLAIRVAAPEDMPLAEETLRRSSYKDTDATVARFNRKISLPISVALIPTPLTANQLSVILVAIGFYSAWLFSLGFYWTGILGAFLSLAASILDGCDGEIARLKYQESALGCWIETFGDYSYYIAIFIGLTFGAVRQTGAEIFYWFGGVTLAGTLISFALLIYLRSRITAGQPEKLHAIARDRFRATENRWSWILWRVSFVATRSAMPYGIMALSLVYLLPAVIVLAAIGANIYWITLVVKLKHLMSDDQETVAA